jgi:hypothetical protein
VKPGVAAFSNAHLGELLIDVLAFFALKQLLRNIVRLRHEKPVVRVKRPFAIDVCQHIKKMIIAKRKLEKFSLPLNS